MSKTDHLRGIDRLPESLKPDPNDLRMIAAHNEFYCTYCEYYGSPRFTGSWGEVVEHADQQHPLGDPRDVAQPTGETDDGRAW